MQNLRASVIIATYNRAHVICRAISSALAAIRPGDEVIVIDDGSVDQTERVIAPYRDRIRYLAVEHRGAGAARNRGIREAKNELIAFLDSDDEWLPGQLELQRSLMERSEEHTSELQSHHDLVCRLLLEKKKKKTVTNEKELHTKTRITN